MTTYQIAILHHYYHPDLQGGETPRIYCDDDNNPIEYDTIEDARAVIDEWDNDIYVTSHNESGRPIYLVVESVDGDYIHGGRNGDGSNYDWDGYEDFCARLDGDNCCGECQGCIRYMIDADREYLLNSAVYKS